MRNKLIFLLSAVGVALAVVSAVIFGERPNAQPPTFNPAANPYAKGIYAVGIVESAQEQGVNVNLYPEITGPVTRVLVKEGDRVKQGDALINIDDSIQRATAEAALALLRELKAQPRPETLAVAAAQVENARAQLKNVADTHAKLEVAFSLDPDSVSRDVLDTARNTEKMAATNLEMIEKQYVLTKAGAWSYDIETQEKQAAAAVALLDKYTLRAPADGVVLAINAEIGSTVTTLGAYDPYTEGNKPLLILGGAGENLQVRAFIDEILVHSMADPAKLAGQMFIRGTDVKIPLTFVRVQPYVSPKIELSDERQERVDVRVLPVIFRFDKPAGLNLYRGQLVDVYVGEK
jgi:HlyD family secretion protein